MDYITIDFETASSSLSSACSIGIIGVSDNKVVLSEHYLINPEEEFSSYNESIHHITYMDVMNEPSFPIIWDKIKKYFNNTIVFAHNAQFDLSVLKALIEKYNLEVPNIKFGCTLKIASKLWLGELKNLKLNTIAEFLECSHDHHNALSDANVCVEIIKRSLKVMQVDNVSALYESLGFRYGVYNGNKYMNTYNIYMRKKNAKVIDNNILNDKVIFLAGKPKHYTRNNLIYKLIENGVYVEKNVNLSLDYFVLLDNIPKAKLELVKKYIDKGAKINIISEDELLRMIKNE